MLLYVRILLRHFRRNICLQEKLLEGIQHNDFMSENHKKTCEALNYFQHFSLFISALSGCVLIFAFVLLVGISV